MGFKKNCCLQFWFLKSLILHLSRIHLAVQNCNFISANFNCKLRLCGKTNYSVNFYFKLNKKKYTCEKPNSKFSVL
uniref:Secreted protein n=1 Tax=Kalanchoe fedtschenkoi TaxID=63787 RepID=A0A7N0VBM4_KALFE